MSFSVQPAAIDGYAGATRTLAADAETATAYAAQHLALDGLGAVATDPVPSFVDLIFSLPDLVSPSHWLLWVLDQVCGVNPVEWFAKEFAGDWGAVQRAGKALAALGDFTETAATGIRTGAGGMLRQWDGNAADAAERYFAGLADAVDEQASPLRSIGNQYEAVAFGMWSAAKTVVSLMEALLDSALITAALAAAAAASSWTVVGGVAGTAATLASLARTAHIWYLVLQAHGKAVNLALGVTGLIAGYLGAVQGLQAHPLPPGAYDHPGV